MEPLVHAANILYLVSYYARDTLRLRIFAVIAGMCLIPYLYLRPEPLIAAACWNAFFVLLNAWRIAVVLRERRDRVRAGTAAPWRGMETVPSTGVDSRPAPLEAAWRHTAAFKVSRMVPQHASADGSTSPSQLCL